MNRDAIFNFISQFSMVYLCGTSRSFEAVCWYFDNNNITYQIYQTYCSQKLLIDRIGYFILEDSPEIEIIKQELKDVNPKDLYYFSKNILRELICMKQISSDNDSIQAKELILAVRNGMYKTSFIEKYNNSPLMYIKNFYCSSIYKEVFHSICTWNKQEKDKKNKLKIGFLIKHSSEWSAESIWKHMECDETYELMIFIAPYWVGTKRSILDNYHTTIQYFKDKGYPFIKMYDEEKENYMQWTPENTCDYMFNLTANFIYLKKTTCIVKFPLTTINIHIPYGYYISGFVESQFNQLSHMLFWKSFCESYLHKEMAGKFSDIGNDNVEFSGYLKMDYYYKHYKLQNNKIWSIPKDCKFNNMKKIIYAPHWSIADSKTAYGSFEKNYKFLLEYARKTRNEISWIIKPHPRLRSECVIKGIFATEDDFDEYLKCWNDLDNASSITVGTYEDIFITSDAILLDSISFMAEYMYVHKPIILITRKEQTFNDFGIELTQTLYHVDGNNNEEIKNAIEEIVLSEKDNKKEMREIFFRKYLDYYRLNGIYATEYIMQFIRRN